jgi:Ca-activated chloride channel family protein
VRTAALRIDQYEQVSLVNLYAIVRDAKGAYVGGLTRDDFRVTENGRPQTISRFSDEWKPLRIAIVLDTSLSMQGDKLDAAREAARSFLEVLRPEDQGLVVLFHDSVDVVQPLTSARSELEAAIGKARAKGGTALYDAIWRTADLLDSIEGRRVIVLLSDGRDEAASGLEPGSLHTQEEALDRALRAETMIFSIGFGRNPATEWDFFRRRSLESILRELSEATGGRSLFSSRAGKLRKAFEQVADDLRHQYSLAYTSDDPRRDGSWRGIQVTSARPDLRVVSRQGYFAPKDKTAPKAPTKKR